MADTFFLDLRSGALKEQFEPLFKSVSEEKPLPSALICAAFIDKCLKQILEAIFIKGQTATKIMKDEVGLLGSLFARARILYLMGRIDSTIFENISLIGQIRNLFAHNHTPLTFDSPEVSVLCDKLKLSHPHVSNVWTKTEGGFNNRGKFSVVSFMTIIWLALLFERLTNPGTEIGSVEISTTDGGTIKIISRSEEN